MDTLIVSSDRDRALAMLDVLVPHGTQKAYRENTSTVRITEHDGAVSAWVMPRTACTGRRFDVILVDKALLEDAHDRDWVQIVIAPLLKKRSTDCNTLIWY